MLFIWKGLTVKMKKFKFRLQSILKLKISLEEQGKARLAQLNFGINNVTEQIFFVSSETSNRKQELLLRLKKGENATVLHVYSEYFAALREKKKSLEERLKVLEEKREQEQKILAELMQERKALEKLKARQYAEYLQALEREQQMIISEFLTFNAATADSV